MKPLLERLALTEDRITAIEKMPEAEQGAAWDELANGIKIGAAEAYLADPANRNPIINEGRTARSGEFASFLSEVTGIDKKALMDPKTAKEKLAEHYAALKGTPDQLKAGYEKTIAEFSEREKVREAELEKVRTESLGQLSAYKRQVQAKDVTAKLAAELANPEAITALKRTVESYASQIDIDDDGVPRIGGVPIPKASKIGTYASAAEYLEDVTKTELGFLLKKSSGEGAGGTPKPALQGAGAGTQASTPTKSVAGVRSDVDPAAERARLLATMNR